MAERAPVLPDALGSDASQLAFQVSLDAKTYRYGDPIVFDRVADPSREQQQEVANDIFTHIRGLYAELDAEGRAGVARRVRELRRAERKGTATA